MSEFYVDNGGWIHSTTSGALNVNMFHRNDRLLLRGRYERTGFGLTAQEKRAAVYLGLFEE